MKIDEDMLMRMSVEDGDWPYVAGLALLEKSYSELSDEVQALVRTEFAQWGEDHPHEFWSTLSHEEAKKISSRAIRTYNEAKREKRNA